MSKSDILYVKNMNISEGDGEDGDEDIWDDRKLNDAYDKALKMANAEVAKRVAMSTNSQNKKSVSDTSQRSGGQPKSIASHKKKGEKKWKTGMPCRAIYEEDGLEYEACVLSLLDDNKCVVRFLGYNNTEIVPTSTLKTTKGEEARMRQIEEALVSEDQPVEYMSQSSHAGSITGASEHGERNLLEAEMASSKHSKSSKKKKRRNQKSINGFDLPQMPFQMPNLSMLMNSGSSDMPLPPPPPMMFPPGKDDEDQAVSSMLLSWYMSGYYTGLYQGLKRSKENGRNK